MTVDELNLGGGLGVRYVSSDEGPSIAQHVAAVQEVVAKALAAHGVRSRPRLMVEPGRSIAGPAGLTLYTVGTVKTIPELRTYVAVDGGMSDNLRPVTYGARYETFLPGRVRRGALARGDDRGQALRAGRPARAGCAAPGRCRGG